MTTIRLEEGGQGDPLLPSPVELVLMAGLGLLAFAVLAALAVGAVVLLRSRARGVRSPSGAPPSTEPWAAPSSTSTSAPTTRE